MVGMVGLFGLFGTIFDMARHIMPRSVPSGPSRFGRHSARCHSTHRSPSVELSPTGRAPIHRLRPTVHPANSATREKRQYSRILSEYPHGIEGARPWRPCHVSSFHDRSTRGRHLG